MLTPLPVGYVIYIYAHSVCSYNRAGCLYTHRSAGENCDTYTVFVSCRLGGVQIVTPHRKIRSVSCIVYRQVCVYVCVHPPLSKSTRCV